MADDPFERARKEIERAQRDFDERMQRIHEELHHGIHQAQRRIAEAKAEFQDRMARFSTQMRRAGRPPLPGLKKPPRGGSSSGNRKPRRPDWGGPDRSGPQPMPVRPINPSLLTGGAEAPLDE
jgi:hypothetical protein